MFWVYLVISFFLSLVCTYGMASFGAFSGDRDRWGDLKSNQEEFKTDHAVICLIGLWFLWRIYIGSVTNYTIVTLTVTGGILAIWVCVSALKIKFSPNSDEARWWNEFKQKYLTKQLTEDNKE